MSDTTNSARSLPPQGAFVLQLSGTSARDAGGAPGSFAGRVEHVTSGRVTRFATLAELTEFLVTCLPSPSMPGSGESRDLF